MSCIVRIFRLLMPFVADCVLATLSTRVATASKKPEYAAHRWDSNEAASDVGSWSWPTLVYP